MKTRYIIRHKITKQGFVKREQGKTLYSDLSATIFASATEASIMIIKLGAENILEVHPI